MILCLTLFFQSPDGKLVASGAIDGIINLFDLQSGRLLHTLEGICTLMVVEIQARHHKASQPHSQNPPQLFVVYYTVCDKKQWRSLGMRLNLATFTVEDSRLCLLYLTLPTERGIKFTEFEPKTL